jgi:putative hemolysin
VGNIALIFLFILIGGVFAAAEMALVSLRESQIKQLAERGKRGATVARLSSDPNKFLSAVQIGVTLSGFLSAAFGGALLSSELAGVFISWGMHAAWAQPLALVVITIVISYFSIVIGELTSKRLAMQNAESYSLVLGPFVNGIAKVFSPVIWLLTVSTNGLVRLLGGNPDLGREEVSEDELRAMVGSSAALGVEERAIVDEVFSAADISLREAMVPRTEVDFLAGSLPIREAITQAAALTHSRYPVTGESSDDILGFVHIRDFLELDEATLAAELQTIVRPVISLPQSIKIFRALSVMREAQAQLAIVEDEYGGTAGIVTLEDLVEELVGDITDEFDVEEEDATEVGERVIDLDGLTTLEEFEERFGFEIPQGPYDTVAGYLMAQLGELPRVGDAIDITLTNESEQTATFELRVTEVDGRRAARLRCTKTSPAPSSDPPSEEKASA